MHATAGSKFSITAHPFLAITGIGFHFTFHIVFNAFPEERTFRKPFISPDHTDFIFRFHTILAHLREEKVVIIIAAGDKSRARRHNKGNSKIRFTEQRFFHERLP